MKYLILLMSFVFCLVPFTAFADENGKVLLKSENCQANNYLSVQNLCKLIDIAGIGCAVTADTCVSATQEMFTGNLIEFASPSNIKPWNGLGGMGAPYSMATSCLMRDIVDLGEKKFRTHAAATTFLGDVRAEQEVGFLSFNKDTGVFEGYQRMKACGPVVGCIDAFTQKFKLTPVKSSKVGSGLKAGQYDVKEAYALDLWAEGAAQGIKVTLPSLSVPTPVGPVNVNPEFRFGRATGFIIAPYDGNSKSSFPDAALGLTQNQTFDIYGRNPGSNATTMNPVEIKNNDGFSWTYNPKGWFSQIALGSRDADPKHAVWAPAAGVEFPSRPDADYKTARSKLEKTPNAYLGASIEAKYDITNILPSALLKLGCSGFVKICIEQASVFAKPTIDVGYTSQLNFGQNEQSSWNKKTISNGTVSLPDLSPMNFDQSKSVGIFAAASTAARFALEAGLDLTIRLKINGIFTKINKVLVNLHPRTTVVESTTVGYSDKPVIAFAHSRSSKIISEKRFFQNYTTFAGVNLAAQPGDGGAQHIKQCFAKPSESAPMPPEPTYEPGNPEQLVEIIEYPCNICVGWDDINFLDDAKNPQTEKGQVGIIFPASQASMPAGTRWACKVPAESGCYDMCRMDAGGKLIVVRTALQMIASGEVKDMPTVCSRYRQ